MRAKRDRYVKALASHRFNRLTHLLRQENKRLSNRKKIACIEQSSGWPINHHLPLTRYGSEGIDRQSIVTRADDGPLRHLL